MTLDNKVNGVSIQWKCRSFLSAGSNRLIAKTSDQIISLGYFTFKRGTLCN